MKRRRTTAIVCLLFLLGCEPHGSGPEFSRDVVPILKRHCVMCHMSEGAQGELSLHPQPYTALVGAKSSQSDLPLVTPGDVDASYLYHKLLGTHLAVGGEGESMPYQRDLLVQEELSIIEQWISRGAKDD